MYCTQKWYFLPAGRPLPSLHCPPPAASLPAGVGSPARPARRRKVSLSVGHYARTLPLAATLGMPRVSVDPATFLPPPLRKQAVGWYPEFGKASPCVGG